MRLTERRLRSIIRNVIKESNVFESKRKIINYSAFESALKELLDNAPVDFPWEKSWEKVKPAYEPVGFEPDEDPWDLMAKKASKLLNCEINNLMQYWSMGEHRDYELAQAVMYATGFLGVRFGYPGQVQGNGKYVTMIAPNGLELLFTTSSNYKLLTRKH